jgi:hypothetical protein
MLQINVIREKAGEAEAIVRTITTDIQRLDVAKRNLTGAIQTVERWELLSQSTACRLAQRLMVCAETAHAQLRDLLPGRRYKEIAQALSVSSLGPIELRLEQTVTHLIHPLKSLNTIPAVADLIRSADEDRKTVQEKVAAEMDILYVKVSDDLANTSDWLM